MQHTSSSILNRESVQLFSEPFFEQTCINRENNTWKYCRAKHATALKSKNPNLCRDLYPLTMPRPVGLNMNKSQPNMGPVYPSSHLFLISA